MELLQELDYPAALRETLHEMEMNVSLGGDGPEENVLRERARAALTATTNRS